MPTLTHLVRNAKCNATALSNASPFALGTTAPNTVVDVFGERVFEAIVDNRTRGTNCAGPVDTGTINREENGGREVAAIALTHPSS